MTATAEPVRHREFVVRLESPGLYDDLYDESVTRTKENGRRVPMTELCREALEQYLARAQKARR